ncbi:MAG: hypothetical protein QE269_02300 [Fimbriimonas sp.]|nr:hypothetical protein [Fimbriimonas sp.]
MLCFGLSISDLIGLTPIAERIQRDYIPPRDLSVEASGKELTVGMRTPRGFSGSRTIVILPGCSSCNVNLPFLPFKREGDLETLYLTSGDSSGWARLGSKGTSRVVTVDAAIIRYFDAEFQPRTYHVDANGRLDYVQQIPKEFESVAKELSATLPK